MNDGHALRNAFLAVIGLVIVGALAWWLIKALIGLILYAVLGGLLVGGALHLYGKTRRSIRR